MTQLSLGGAEWSTAVLSHLATVPVTAAAQPESWPRIHWFLCPKKSEKAETAGPWQASFSLGFSRLLFWFLSCSGLEAFRCTSGLTCLDQMMCCRFAECSPCCPHVPTTFLPCPSFPSFPLSLRFGLHLALYFRPHCYFDLLWPDKADEIARCLSFDCTPRHRVWKRLWEFKFPTQKPVHSSSSSSSSAGAATSQVPCDSRLQIATCANNYSIFCVFLSLICIDFYWFVLICFAKSLPS